MSEEKRQRLKKYQREYQKNYCGVKKSQYEKNVIVIVILIIIITNKIVF